MPQYICSFVHHDSRYYFEWSTIVDAPITKAMRLEPFLEHYKKYKGSIDDIDDRLLRAMTKGTSSHPDESLDDLMAYNRAGVNEEQLELHEIYQKLIDSIDPDKESSGNAEGNEVDPNDQIKLLKLDLIDAEKAQLAIQEQFNRLEVEFNALKLKFVKANDKIIAIKDEVVEAYRIRNG